MKNYRQLRRLEKLRTMFDKLGIRPSTRMGQNFLLDKNQVNYIARAGNTSPLDLVLEIGPGTGFLTKELLETGARVLAVELDRKLAEHVESEFGEVHHFELIKADILHGKNDINPDVIARVRELLAEYPELHLKSVANLPYSAGTPFAANMFASDLPWERAVFLLQMEVAERMVAGPGSPEYGALSIVCALGGNANIQRKVPPQVFWPRPKVNSAVVSIDFNPVEDRLAIPWKALRQVTVAVFSSRRKRLRNSLKGLLAKENLDDSIAELGLDPECRGEHLPPEDFLKIARSLEV